MTHYADSSFMSTTNLIFGRQKCSLTERVTPWIIGYTMSREIEAVVKDGRIELPAGVDISDNTPVTVIVPECSNEDAAFMIPGLAKDIGPEDLAANFEHYCYGHSRSQ